MIESLYQSASAISLFLAAATVIGSEAAAQERSAPLAHPIEIAPPGAHHGARQNEGDMEQSYVTTAIAVRAAPGNRARVVGRLKRGDFVNVGRCERTWCKVDAHGGSGWVSGRFIGRGDNPYHDLGPAGPGIPKQQPGTHRPHPRPVEGQM